MFCGAFLSDMNVKRYLGDFEESRLLELVTFLFQYGQQKAAIEFGDKMAHDNNSFYDPRMRSISNSDTQRLQKA